MLIIADSHVNPAKENVKDFFELLDAIAKTDEDVVFIGDNFDLWIALPRYETATHHRFLQWCKEQKKHRSVGYVEGNHEFFLCDSWCRCFTWCTPHIYHNGSGISFAHGDTVNTKEQFHFIFRKLTRNAVMRTVMRILPFGPKLVVKVKEGMNKINARRKFSFPEKQVAAFAEARFKEGADIVFCGHFHHYHEYNAGEGRKLYLLPDWVGAKQITRFNPQSRELTVVNSADLHETV